MAKILFKRGPNGPREVEVGPETKDYVLLLNWTVAELDKLGHDTAYVSEKLERRSGGSLEAARAYVHCTERLLAGDALAESWTVWCGSFAARSSVSESGTLILRLLLVLAALAAFPFIIRGQHSQDIATLLRVWSFACPIVLLWIGVSAWHWVKHRADEWPPVPADLSREVIMQEENGKNVADKSHACA